MLIYINRKTKDPKLLAPGVPVVCNQITGILFCGYRLIYLDKNFSSDFQEHRWTYIWFIQLIMLLFAFLTNKFLMWLHKGTLINILDENYSISAIIKFVCSTDLTNYSKQTPCKLIVLSTKKVLFVVLVVCSIFLLMKDIFYIAVTLTNEKFDVDQIIIFIFSFFVPIISEYFCCTQVNTVKTILFFIPYYVFACYILALYVLILPFCEALRVQRSLKFFVFCFGLIKFLYHTKIIS